jgi:hypothetical protein
MATLVSGTFVSVAVLVMGRLMLAICVAMMMVAVMSGRCASEVGVETIITLVSMVDGDAAARYAERVQEQPLARSRRGESRRPIPQLSTCHPRP